MCVCVCVRVCCSQVCFARLPWALGEKAHIQLNRKRINISSFVTRPGSDFLIINGLYYSGFLDSAELVDPPQGIIRWIPDTWSQIAFVPGFAML